MTTIIIISVLIILCALLVLFLWAKSPALPAQRKTIPVSSPHCTISADIDIIRPFKRSPNHCLHFHVTRYTKIEHGLASKYFVGKACMECGTILREARI